MQLNVSKEKAIKILNKRLAEIDAFDFEPNSWKKKTQNDVNQIFNDLTRSFQVTFITFDTSSLKEASEKGKKEARELIKSFIENIEEYVVDYDGSFAKNLMNDLKLGGLKTENQKISQENEKLKRNLVLKNDQIARDKKTISHLIANTVQLDKLTLSKLSGLITNLPIQHSIALGTIIITLISSVFLLGVRYQETFFQDERYELNRKYETILNDKSVLADSLKRMKSTTILDSNSSDGKTSVVIFNSNKKAISVKFENISKNNDQIKSQGISIHPYSFGKIDLEKSNYRFEVKRFIDYKKNALTESDIYVDSIFRINQANDLKTIHVR